MSLLYKDWFLIPAVSMCVFIICYLWLDKIINYLQSKSLGSRSEVIRILNLMHVETDEKKITIVMLLLSFGLGIVFFLLLLPNAGAGIAAACVVTVAGWKLPVLIVKNLYDRRSQRLVEQMVDGLTIMANGISSGLSVTQCMDRVVENLGAPISQEFSLVLSQVRLGRTLEEALTEFGERNPLPDVQMFVTAINILKETGGNMGETFATIVTTIRERQKVEKKIQAMTAQGMTQGIIVTMIPFALIAVFLFVDPDFIMPMFTSFMGIILLGVMLTLQVIGGLAIRKVVSIKV